MSNGILYRYVPEEDEEDPQLVVPRLAVPRILAEYHDNATAGHFGVDRTLHRISSRYYWPNMRRDVTTHLSKCMECQRFKITNLKPGGLPFNVNVLRLFPSTCLVLCQETPEGHKWIFIVEDTASRWTELFPLKVATAEECAKCLVNEVILRYGVPRKVISDNGPQFVSEITSYLDGLSRTLKAARETQEKSQDNSKKYADAKRRNVSPFKEGDQVMVETHVLSRAKHSITSKFAPKRDGPYTVHRVVTPTTFEISSSDNPNVPLGKYHISALTPYRGDKDETPLKPIRRRGRPPKKGQPNVPDAPPVVPQKVYDLRTSPTSSRVASRTGRTRDPKGEI
ncbi:hypothetical protein NQ318_004486, partial [Aromia moschata]